ncbi:iron-sulfur cluster assembly 1 homolog, mitochondrial-like [Stylophora pistillata]|uniref:iron-sulfur cluster assembly 1 homolog, mitochondrial-like n=1 Tax=Stylophora pistillata TaxID=50429 RepID=UPI000C03C079|nr:iron-sulfur cluster assembly 1 homolog, mitochondrial-like [Stylophora pistillata]
MQEKMAARTAIGAAVRAVNKPRKFAARRAAITLTPAAVQKLKSLLKPETENNALRIGVKQKGCNGLSYTLDYANEKGKFDEEVNQDGKFDRRNLNLGKTQETMNIRKASCMLFVGRRTN